MSSEVPESLSSVLTGSQALATQNRTFLHPRTTMKAFFVTLVSAAVAATSYATLLRESWPLLPAFMGLFVCVMADKHLYSAWPVFLQRCTDSLYHLHHRRGQSS